MLGLSHLCHDVARTAPRLTFPSPHDAVHKWGPGFEDKRVLLMSRCGFQKVLSIRTEIYLIYETPGDELLLNGVVDLHSPQLFLGQVSVASQTSEPVVLCFPLADSSPCRKGPSQALALFLSHLSKGVPEPDHFTLSGSSTVGVKKLGSLSR